MSAAAGTPVAAYAQCTFSPLEPGPSALVTAPPRTAFPISTPAGDTEYIDKAGKKIPAPPDTSGSGLTLYKEFVEGHPRYGYRDSSGAVKIKPQYLDALPFSGDLAGVKDATGKWGFIDRSGAMRIAPQFRAVDDFSGDRAAVDQCDKCGYIDDKGKPAFNATFRHCYRFQNHVAKVEISAGSWGFIDESGKTLAKLSNGEFALYSDGLMPAERGSGPVGFVDTSGKFAIEPRFAFVEPFSEGLAAVKEDKAWGYIDKSGKYAITPRFCDPADPRGGYFHEGLAFVCDAKTRLYGFVDRAGKSAISPQFAKCNDPSGDHCAFDGGLAWVETKAQEGYINPQGKFVWSRPVGKGR